MRKKPIDQMTPEEIAALDEEYEGEAHPSECPAMVANDEGVLGDHIPDEAIEKDEES